MKRLIGTWRLFWMLTYFAFGVLSLSYFDFMKFKIWCEFAVILVEYLSAVNLYYILYIFNATLDLYHSSSGEGWGIFLPHFRVVRAQIFHISLSHNSLCWNCRRRASFSTFFFRISKLITAKIFAIELQSHSARALYTIFESKKKFEIAKN